jgi:hypothetical protein
MSGRLAAIQNSDRDLATLEIKGNGFRGFSDWLLNRGIAICEKKTGSACVVSNYECWSKAPCEED